MNTLMIVDDHILFREGMRNIIRQWDDFKLVGEAANGEEAVALARQLRPDIILMDIFMPGMDGIEATRQIAREMPETHIVMLTTSENEEDLKNACRSGAHGYVLKDTPAKKLHDELCGLMAGEAPLSGLMATKMMQEFCRSCEQAEPERIEPLTEREQQVLKLLVAGYSNSEIAERVFLSENTVKKHLRSIQEKFHAANRVEAAVYAVRAGLV
jgi:DNA-binding NarL/FixJ family response regulator